MLSTALLLARLLIRQLTLFTNFMILSLGYSSYIESPAYDLLSHHYMALNCTTIAALGICTWDLLCMCNSVVDVPVQGICKLTFLWGTTCLLFNHAGKPMPARWTAYRNAQLQF